MSMQVCVRALQRIEKRQMDAAVCASVREARGGLSGGLLRCSPLEKRRNKREEEMGLSTFSRDSLVTSSRS
ncbi:hypothetical protein MHYP_G00226890 [Metynnis hypsauchen]